MINLVKRNLEQQVLKNQYDIEALKELGMPGVKITDVVDSIEEIIQPIIGAFYLVKNAQNTYNLYFYTVTDEFFDMGEFPKSGPQGIAGIQGPKGETGVSTRWYSGISFPLTNVKDGDMFLNTSSYQVYIRNNGQWVSQTNIKGAAGRDGLNGNSITSIDKQRRVDKTVITINTEDLEPVIFDIPDGKPGAGFHIKDILTYATPLPNDIIDILNEKYPPAQRDYSEAVLVKCVYLDNSQTIQKSYVFVIIDGQDSNKKWDNAGQIEGIEGPAGDPGDRIMDTAYITKSPQGAQYPNTYKLYINSIPYLNQAPVIDNTPPGELCFKVVMLPKSLEASTVRKNGYVYFFYEDPQTP